tara:strand:- start:46 stop:330 length:285 start_codon:yes stop_codon:yes gene_type:complete
MLLETILAGMIGTATVEVNEVPGHISVKGYAYVIRETDYGCTSTPREDEVKLNLGDICYRVVNKPDFHKIDDRWGWSLWEWMGKRTNEEFIDDK